jgi:hypothetical protein
VQVAPASAAREPRIYGGTQSGGNPAVVAIAIQRGASWTSLCTGVMWRPRLVLTSAHCVTKPGSSAPADGIAVFPPGQPAVVFSNTGPQGASAARVVQRFVPSTYVNGNGSVSRDDLAVLQLDADLAPTPFARLATRAELDRWVAERAAMEHVGYGLVGPNTSRPLPFAVSIPMQSYTPAGSLGDTFATAQNASVGLCPGDSGSPVYRFDGTQSLLAGVLAGSNSPCQNPPSRSIFNVIVALTGYLPLLNSALTAVGSPAIPGAPVDVAAVARNREVTVSWLAPVIAPEAVTGYEVLDGSGALVCATAETRCVLPDRPDGSVAFTVRARNAEGEGDAAPATTASTALVAGPPVPARPSAALRRGSVVVSGPSVAARTSAVVTGYRVVDRAGRLACEAAPPASGRWRCTLPAQPGRERYRVQVLTEMGASALSRPSRVVRVPD